MGVLFLEFSSQNLISTTIAHFIFLVFDGLVILLNHKESKYIFSRLFFFSIELNFRIKLQEHLRFCIPLIMTFASDKQGAGEQVITIAFK